MEEKQWKGRWEIKGAARYRREIDRETEKESEHARTHARAHTRTHTHTHTDCNCERLAPTKLECYQRAVFSTDVGYRVSNT
jgi:hypothetical protein